MPQIPDKRALGALKINGRATPAQINPNVAYDIGRAGAAWARAFDEVAGAFAAFGAKQQATEDQAWLAEAKIATLEADDAIRRETELNAAPDGTGYEQAPLRLKQTIEEVEKRPGGSQEARTKYKLWSAEQGFETGRWAANTAQTKLKGHIGTKVDDRLTTLSQLASSNPDRAEEYAKTFSEEVGSYVGSALTSTEAEERVRDGVQRIQKEALISKIRAKPEDLGKAIRAVGAGTRAFTDQNPETRANPLVTGQAAGGSVASVSFQLETGKTDPLEGISNISPDSAGTKSYGNFGINSGGSAQQFQRKYGAQFGLTAKPGTKAFDEQWKNAAGAAPVELHQAEMEWWNSTIGSKVTNSLVRAGVPSDMANDPRVKAYFADRMVQYGPGSIGNHGARIKRAFEAANGDVGKFLSGMSNEDRGKLQQDFPTALATGVYSRRGHETRIRGREGGAMRLQAEPGGKMAPAHGGPKLDELPKVDGTIQPAELAILTGDQRREVLTQLRPYLTQDVEEKVKNASVSLLTKGSQNLITEEDIDNYEPFIGPKAAAAYREALRESGMLYHINKEINNLTPAEREHRLSELMPTGDPETMSDAQLQHFELYAKAMKTRDEALAKDPLGYLSMNNESGRQAMKIISSATPGEEGRVERERAYGVLLRLQKEEGVPTWKQRILGEKEASRVAQVLQESLSEERSVQELNALKATYGKHFSQAWSELVEAGAPAYLRAMTTATEKGQSDIFRALAMEKASNEAAGKDRANVMLDKAGAKKDELERAVTDRISPFTDTLRLGATGGAQMIEGYRSAVKQLALYYMSASGLDINNAVDQAANEIYNRNVIQINGINVPADEAKKSHVVAGITEAKVDLIKSIDPGIVLNTKDINSSKKYGKDYTGRRYIDETASYGRFVASPDGDGVWVLDVNDRVLMTGSDQDPRPILIPWYVAEHYGKTHRMGRAYGGQ